AVAAATAGVVTMGGWAVVSVKDVPEYFVAGQEYTIEFQVRQHGRNLLSQLEPRLLVSSSERRLGGLLGGKDATSIPAVARSEGVYAATFTAPAVEQVFLTIKSGFGPSNLRLYPQPVVAAGASRAAMAIADRGRVLFVAKGCNACHANADLTDRPDNQEIGAGPALGGGRLARQYVIQKLKQPASQAMPDLGLSDAEVTALAAFLSSDRPAAAGGDEGEGGGR
ncbi:MAG: cytochrome c, partial [Gemmatimonadales bacterium]